MTSINMPKEVKLLPCNKKLSTSQTTLDIAKHQFLGVAGGWRVVGGGKAADGNERTAGARAKD